MSLSGSLVVCVTVLTLGLVSPLVCLSGLSTVGVIRRCRRIATAIALSTLLGSVVLVGALVGTVVLRLVKLVFLLLLDGLQKTM